MTRALAVAARGLGRVEPNPMVGAVLLRDGEAVAEGWHTAYGGPHAEVAALAAAREAGVDPGGLTMAVSLEPCSHHGKTPPCADALIAAGVARVVVAMTDPNPEVAGRGIARLRAAGVEVVEGVLEAEARQLNRAYLKRVEAGRPWVTLKWAQTLDGRIATASGDSKWITGDAARRRVHELRGRVDAVMVGIGTAVADNPRLTARGVEVRRVARRVVVDPALRLPRDSHLLTDDGPPVTLATSGKADPTGLPGAVEIFKLNTMFERQGSDGGSPGVLELGPLMRHLAEAHGATNVLVEGGAKLAGALFEQGLVDEVWAFVAPRVAGDDSARGAVSGLRCLRIDDTLRLTLEAVERVGDDVLLRYVVPARSG